MKSPPTLEEIAVRRMKRKRGFYRHLGIWLSISLTFLAFLTLIGEPLRAVFEMAGVFLLWGAAVAIHYVVVFGLPFFGFGGPEWEERQFNREMDQLEGLANEDRLELRDLERQRERQELPRRDDFV